MSYHSCLGFDTVYGQEVTSVNVRS